MNRAARWEAWTAWPLLALSVLFIGLYTVAVLDGRLFTSDDVAIHVSLAAIWVVFIVDYLVRLFLAPRRGAFVRGNIAALLSAIIPVFRPFLVLAYLRQVPFFRRRSAGSLRTQMLLYAATFVVIFVYTISLTVLQVERNAPGATITGFGDAIWWACVTLTTVGYGDMVPVTVIGRVLAVGLMLGGVAIVGVASATILSVLNERIEAARRHLDH